MRPDEYNYPHFALDEQEQEAFEAFRRARMTGQKAPDAELVDAATGETVQLSTLWRARPVVLEFGSLT